MPFLKPNALPARNPFDVSPATVQYSFDTLEDVFAMTYAFIHEKTILKPNIMSDNPDKASVGTAPKGFMFAPGLFISHKAMLTASIEDFYRQGKSLVAKGVHCITADGEMKNGMVVKLFFFTSPNANMFKDSQYSVLIRSFGKTRAESKRVVESLATRLDKEFAKVRPELDGENE